MLDSLILRSPVLAGVIRLEFRLKKLLTGLLFLCFSFSAFSENEICPTQENKPWDKLEEKAFSKDAAKTQLESLNKLFSGEI